MRRYKAGIRERNIQVEAHHGFTASLPKELVGEWEQTCKEWDEDGYPKQSQSPYHTEGTSMLFFATYHVRY
jgi:hypothetical protein